jgi:hypothetical protein
MPSFHAPPKRLIAVAMPVVIGLALTACSSSSSSSPNTHTSAPPSTSSTPPSSSPSTSSPSTTSSAEPTSGAAAIAAIKANWITFFTASTPNARRIQLLEDGQLFAAAIKALGASPFAATSSASVSNVSLTSASQAAVKYDILVSGAPILKNQAGTAVYQDGLWKVGFKSFCALLILENAGKTAGLPSVCQG